MRKIVATSLILASMTFNVFANKPPKDIKKITGTWQLVEFKQTKYLPGSRHEIVKKSSNGNTKEYILDGSSFKSYNNLKKLIQEGNWTIADDKLVEEVNPNSDSPLRGAISAYEYKLKKNKLIIKYNASARNDAFITETWKRVKVK